MNIRIKPVTLFLLLLIAIGGPIAFFSWRKFEASSRMLQDAKVDQDQTAAELNSSDSSESNDQPLPTDTNSYIKSQEENSYSLYKKEDGNWKEVSADFPDAGLYYKDGQFVGYGMSDFHIDSSCVKTPDSYFKQIENISKQDFVEYKKVGIRPRPISYGLDLASVYLSFPLHGDIKIVMKYYSDKDCTNQKTFSTIVKK